MRIIYKKLSDEELFVLMKKGNQRSFQTLYERYLNPLLEYANKKIQGDESFDVVHDVFEKIWHKRELITLTGKFSNYVFRALKNRIQDINMKDQKLLQYLNSTDDFTNNRTANNTDHQVRAEYYWKNLERTLNEYGKDAKVIITLYLKGYKNGEIAELLQLSEKTVRNKKMQILKYLKHRLLSG